MTSLGTVELGGTKVLAAAASSVSGIGEPWRRDTGPPLPTVDAVCEFLASKDVAAVGIASFGPIELRPGNQRYGQITTTPKAAWRHFDLLAVVADRLGVPVAIDTDVNGSALGEHRWGALTDTRVGVYITVGTGIGGSVIVDGDPLVGVSHSEIGHLVVRRHPDDDFPGTCPYHGDCLEGLASGPSIVGRFGTAGGDLSASETRRALDIVSYYLGQGLRDLVYTAGPERIVIGGGVSKLEGFHDAVQGQMVEHLAGYPDLRELGRPGYITEPGLGDLSGLAGGLVLAERVGP